MSDFVCMDWDLQAIVRGCSSMEASIDSVMDSPLPESCIFSPSSLQQDGVFKFPDISETTTILDELEELYKPFYPQTIVTASTSISVPTEVNKKPKKLREHQQQQQQQPKLSDSASNNNTTDQSAAQPKRGRKNQHKRVEQKVAADGLACDKWAWRKYGQKPIKGSPYPRSYYRCSSSKGCLARKQVERSSTDPGTFIITYSAEHNHNHPTRRSSLAGSTRNKASTTRGHPHNKEEPLEPTDEIPLVVTSIEDEFMHQESVKKEEDNVLESREGTEFVMPDMLFSNELFPSLEDLEGLLFDQFPDNNISDNCLFIDEPVTLGGGC